ncbi:MAG: ATP-binding protein [Elusimicrobiota bacterium]|jgi:predicted AAA+ superfamily ATPase|nr:ATP-binding protein [Elusimicrobiota bacterium]
MIIRGIEDIIDKYLFKNKVILIYGARQVGKTTLCKRILDKYSQTKKTAFFDCEILDIHKGFETANLDLLKSAIGDKELIVIDEAQLVKDIGKTLKIIHDHIPHVQAIATSSSSFDLASQTAEPMTGRVFSFVLYPFSVKEIANNNSGFLSVQSKMEKLLVYGSYPAVFDKSNKDAQDELYSIADNYLYKDILTFERLRGADQILKLLQLLALQVGNEVSYSEIGQKLAMNHSTVMKYIDLLEKCFVIFKMRAISRNPRNEISKSVKIYFYDLGIRNSIIQSLTPLDLRNDTGGLWENFCIVERRKANQTFGRSVNQYFYRTYNGEEVDLVEEHDGQYDGYEFKYGREHSKKQKNFLENYPNSAITTISKENWQNFLLQ